MVITTLPLVLYPEAIQSVLYAHVTEQQKHSTHWYAGSSLCRNTSTGFTYRRKKVKTGRIIAFQTFHDSSLGFHCFVWFWATLESTVSQDSVFLFPSIITWKFYKNCAAKDEAPLTATVMITTKGMSSFFFRVWKCPGPAPSHPPIPKVLGCPQLYCLVPELPALEEGNAAGHWFHAAWLPGALHI